jgi:cysteine sulfinate desulfinase/cysteine desulfurase-like protein
MGFSDSLALSAIRVSLGHQNTQQEVLDFVTALKSIVNQPV